MIRLNNISKKFRGKTVLKNINLDLTESIGVYGGNGVGKSTLLKIIALIEQPSSGDIFRNGKSIFKNESKYQDLIGYLPQNFNGFQNSTVLDNLMFFSKAKGIKGSKKRREKIRDIMDNLNINRYKDTKLKNLSGGTLKRVGLSQALLNNPKILILDEPTTGLDFKEQVRIRLILNRLKNNGVIIIICSHLIEDLLVLSDEIITLSKGTIKPKLATKDILNKSYTFREVNTDLDGLIEFMKNEMLISFVQKEYSYKAKLIDNNNEGKNCTYKETAQLILNNYEGLL